MSPTSLPFLSFLFLLPYLLLFLLPLFLPILISFLSSSIPSPLSPSLPDAAVSETPFPTPQCHSFLWQGTSASLFRRQRKAGCLWFLFFHLLPRAMPKIVTPAFAVAPCSPHWDKSHGCACWISLGSGVDWGVCKVVQLTSQLLTMPETVSSSPTDLCLLFHETRCTRNHSSADVS